MPPRHDPESTDAEVVVTVGDEAALDLGAVTERLKRAGLQVEQVLDMLGQVTGRVSGGGLAALRKVEGVTDVSISRRIQLPPPGSTIQ